MEKKLKVKYLAVLTGIKASTLYEIESGKTKKPELKTLKKLSEVLNIPYIELTKKAGLDLCQEDDLFYHISMKMNKKERKQVLDLLEAHFPQIFHPAVNELKKSNSLKGLPTTNIY